MSKNIVTLLTDGTEDERGDVGEEREREREREQMLCCVVAQFVEALRYKPEGRGIDSR
jgi:hypothetical protein